MKKFLLFCFCFFLGACSSLMPYKDQNLDYLQGIEKDPNAYRGQVVAFGGEVAGITEDTLRLRLVMKIDAPLYYYATGKGNALSYELLLVTFNKRGMPQMTGIKKGHQIKVLARVGSFETRKNFTGKDIAVLHLLAFALADQTKHRDFFRRETPERQLYESWREGKLFFEESAQDVISRCPKVKAPQLPERFRRPLPPPEPPAEPERGIVFDEEEPTFVLDPQSTVCPEKEPAPSAAPQPATSATDPAQPTPEKTPATPKNATAETADTPVAGSAQSPSLPVPDTAPASDTPKTPPVQTPNVSADTNDDAPKEAPAPSASQNPSVAALPATTPETQTPRAPATAPAEVSPSSAAGN